MRRVVSDDPYKCEPVDGFEIAGSESFGSSSDVDDFSPTNSNTGKASDLRAVNNVQFILEEDDVDLDIYYPGVKLDLPANVINSLTFYVKRLETAAGRYVCMSSPTSCDEAFNDFPQFLLHMRKSHSPCRLYRCIFCGQHVNFEQMQAHIDEHFKFHGNDVNRFPCPYCLVHVDGNRVRDLQQHIERNHSESVIKYPFCRFCNVRFSDVLDYCSHLEKHSSLLFHCPFENCLVKSPDKMLIVQHVSSFHNSEMRFSRYFRSTRQFLCNLKKHSSNRLCLQADELSSDEPMRIILLNCPVCERYTTRKYNDFLVHLSNCNVGSDGEELEISPEESEVEFLLYMCSNCTVTSTLQSAIKFHLRTGTCFGAKASILVEQVLLERSTSFSLSLSLHRRRSSVPPAETDVLSTASLDHSSTTSTDATQVTKDEPVVIKELLGLAMAHFDGQQLRTDPEILANFDNFAKIKEISQCLDQIQISVFSSECGEHVFLCPKCSRQFSSTGAVQKFGIHLFTDHYSIPSVIAHRCVIALKFHLQHSNGNIEIIPGGNTHMVIKDEPPTPTPSIVSAVSQVDVSKDKRVDSSDSQRTTEKEPEWKAVTLRYSETILEKVQAMLNPGDRELLRDHIINFVSVSVRVNKERKFNCEDCGIHMTTSGFIDIRRHVLRKHCHVPERLLQYMLLLVRQQVDSTFHLVSDDLYERILALPTVGQTKFNHKVRSFISAEKKAGREPTTESIEQHILEFVNRETRVVNKSPEKVKLKPVFKSWREKKLKTLKAKPGKLMPSVDQVDIDAASVPSSPCPKEDDSEEPTAIESTDTIKGNATVLFEADKFKEFAERIKMDATAVDGVMRKMRLVSEAKIEVNILPSGRCLFKCSCGEFEEEVQSIKVDDGPRRHALRSHVRIARVHWSSCLQSTTLKLESDVLQTLTQSNDEKSRKRHDSAQVTPTREPKKARVEEPETESLPSNKANSSLVIAGYLFHGMDFETHPLAFLKGRSESELLRDGYVGYSCDTICWERFIEAKKVFVDDPNAYVLRDRCAVFTFYRIYLRNVEGGGRNHVCSACGFAGSYSSRDVRRHMMVVHLGVNIEFVTSLASACQTTNHVLSFSSPQSDKSFGRDERRGSSNNTDEERENHGTAEEAEKNEENVKLKERESSKAREREKEKVKEREKAKEEENKAREREKNKITEKEKEKHKPKELEREKEKIKSREIDKAKNEKNDERKKLIARRQLTSPMASREGEPLPQLPSVRRLVRRCQKSGMTLRPIHYSPTDKQHASRSGRSFLDIPSIIKDHELQPVVCIELLNADDVAKKSMELKSKVAVAPDGLCVLIMRNNTYKCSKCNFVREDRTLVFNHLAVNHANPNELGRFECPRCYEWFNFAHIFSRHLSQKHLIKNQNIAKFENKNWMREFPVLQMR